MGASRNAWIRRAFPAVAVLCVTGCTSPPRSDRPQLSVDDQAEALAHFSVGMLAETAGDSTSALDHFLRALSLDPQEKTLYAPAIASALRLQQNDQALKLCRELRRKHPNELAPMLLHAQACLLAERPEEAETVLREATDAFPKDPDSNLALARFLIAQDQSAEAVAILERTLAQHPQNAELLHLLGTLRIDRARDLKSEEEIRKNIDKGIALLEEALALDPQSPRRWQQLGFAYLALRDIANVQRAFEQAYELAPDDLLIARQLLDVYIEQGLIEQALSICEELIRQTRTDPELWTQYLNEKLSDEYRQELAAYLQDYIDNHSGAPLLYSIQLASIYMDQDQLDRAESVLDTADRIAPDEPRLKATRGYLLVLQKQFETAYRTFCDVIEQAPDAEWTKTPFFTVSYATAALKSGFITEAAEVLAEAFSEEKAILTAFVQQLFSKDSSLSPDETVELLKAFQEIEPEAAEPHYYLAVLLADRKEYAAALESARLFESRAQTGVATNLLTGFFYYQHAVIHERLGELEEAEKRFRKAIELGSPETAASARNYIAYMWAERGEKLDMGLRLIRKALEAEPDNAAFIDTLGWIYYMQGDYESALAELNKAAELTADDPAIWEHIGDTWLKLGDRCAALKNWKKALELAPDEPRLIERIEEHTVSPENCPE